jgi:hypothetical protein
MKQITKILAVFATTSTIAVTAALGQAGPLITLDEFGKGNFNGNPLPSSIQTDPFSGIATLAYNLPFAGVPGDVLLAEPSGVLSDVLRFDGNGRVFFFSEREPTDTPPFDPADVGQFPPPIAGLQPVNLLENGPEGNNGAFYNPGGGLPGDNSAGASYHFISDVPEPGTGLLLGVGAGFLWLRSRKQNKSN